MIEYTAFYKSRILRDIFEETSAEVVHNNYIMSLLSRCSAKCEPIKPAPPVTRNRHFIHSFESKS